MKSRTIAFGFLALFVLGLCSIALAGGKAGKAGNDVTLVDAGTFSVFQNGRRVGTETFRINQRADYSITTSELKLEDGTSQSSELELWPNGNLRKYTWRSLTPEKVQAVLEPGDQILMQHITVGSEKPQDLPYILPPSTIVLDDYFFVHRELLAWRYLATGCAGAATCTLTKAQLGIIVPRQHTPGTVTMEYLGREKVQVHGAEQELSRFNLKSDDQEWQLWLNEQHKLVRILVTAEKTEIVRD